MAEFVMIKEPPPSLCEHWMPDIGPHTLSNNCWCKPILEGTTMGPELSKTTVRHRPIPGPERA